MSRDQIAELAQEPPPKLRQQEETALHDYNECALVEKRRRGDDNEKNHCRLLQQTPPLHDGACRTPTSEQHKIPAATSCPPTPRKRTRLGLEKRKLRFFEDYGRDEVDLFFRSSFAELANKAPNKRRCLSV